jgi:hypothetical protein
VPNVTGDLLAAIVITRSERLPFVIPKEPTKEATTEAVSDERSLNNPA